MTAINWLLAKITAFKDRQNIRWQILDSAHLLLAMSAFSQQFEATKMTNINQAKLFESLTLLDAVYIVLKVVSRFAGWPFRSELLFTARALDSKRKITIAASCKDVLGHPTWLQGTFGF